MQTLIRKKAGLALSMSEKADLRTRKITSSRGKFYSEEWGNYPRREQF